MILEVSLQGVNSRTLATLTFNTPAEVYVPSNGVRRACGHVIGARFCGAAVAGQAIAWVSRLTKFL